jgi:hypothetical protein
MTAPCFPRLMFSPLNNAWGFSRRHGRTIDGGCGKRVV